MQIFEHFDLKKPIERISVFPKRAKEWFRALEKEQKEQLARQAVSLMLMVGVTVGSVVTVMAATRYACVTLDGEAKPTFEINSTATADLLKQAGVSTGTEDIVLRTDEKSGNIDLTVKTAKPVTVAADGKQYAVTAHYGDTVADALEKAGVALGPNDTAAPDVTAKVTDGMKIAVKRRYTVSITADGKTTQALVWEGTVAKALEQAGVTLGAQDTTDKAAGSAVADGMTITVGRVTYQDVTTTQPIAYTTVTKKDSSMNAGTSTVTVQGQEGVQTTVTRRKLCDNKVVQSTVLKTAVTKPAVTKVVTVGTKSLGSGYASVCADGTVVDADGSTVSYRRLFTGRCSCYCTGTTTATGLPAAYGRVAVNPNVIPYGTRLYICSPDGRVVYGYAVAADTGGAAMSGRIIADLYYPSYSQCMNIGTRTMNVYVLS